MIFRALSAQSVAAGRIKPVTSEELVFEFNPFH
jgi:hypothetical protein